jgi:hypothetical protein
MGFYFLNCYGCKIKNVFDNAIKIFYLENLKTYIYTVTKKIKIMDEEDKSTRKVLVVFLVVLAIAFIGMILKVGGVF